jgi:hypothetical protein
VSAHFSDDPGHWRKRAEEMRRLAGDMKEAEAKQTMLRIADDYERLAVRARKRAVGAALASTPDLQSM